MCALFSANPTFIVSSSPSPLSPLLLPCTLLLLGLLFLSRTCIRRHRFFNFRCRNGFTYSQGYILYTFLFCLSSYSTLARVSHQRINPSLPPQNPNIIHRHRCGRGAPTDEVSAAGGLLGQCRPLNEENRLDLVNALKVCQSPSPTKIVYEGFFSSTVYSDDGKLDTESNSGEFWVLFGGFAPIVLWLYEGIRK
ncbi:hypothetical protein JHK82_015734 [Glycine max]|nr:hypothetical protein JHK82_015734 [Glycine max]